MSRFAFQVLVITTLVAAGCGGANSGGRQAVEGNVTLAGEPLDNGTIRFEAVDGERLVEAGSKIVDGRYEISAAQGLSPGIYRVSISSLRESGEVQVTMGQSTSVRVEGLPQRYNRQSELSVAMKPDQPSIFDFDLSD